MLYAEADMLHLSSSPVPFYLSVSPNYQTPSPKKGKFGVDDHNKSDNFVCLVLAFHKNISTFAFNRPNSFF
jgi:hypothetical protein